MSQAGGSPSTNIRRCRSPSSCLAVGLVTERTWPSQFSVQQPRLAGGHSPPTQRHTRRSRVQADRWSPARRPGWRAHALPVVGDSA
jgi:hypothetical protein